MAVTCSRAGRPCLVADINFGKDKELALRDEFYEACAGLRYGELMALSRAIPVHYCTALKWKYNLQFPRKGIAYQVIDWVNAGKPMKQRRPFPENAGMM